MSSTLESHGTSSTFSAAVNLAKVLYLLYLLIQPYIASQSTTLFCIVLHRGWYPGSSIRHPERRTSVFSVDDCGCCGLELFGQLVTYAVQGGLCPCNLSIALILHLLESILRWCRKSRSVIDRLFYYTDASWSVYSISDNICHIT